VNQASPGDTIVLGEGTYTPCYREPNRREWVHAYITTDNLTIRGDGKVVLDGQDRRWGILVRQANNVRLLDIEFIKLRRHAVIFEATRNSVGERLHAHDFNYDNHISGMFRIVGDAYRSGFVNCIADGGGANSISGFEFRENGAWTAGDHYVPPAGYGAAEAAGWEGYPGTPLECFIRKCIAFNFYGSKDHSDCAMLRYARKPLVEGSVFYGAADDGLDMLGCVDGRVRSCIIYGMRGPGNSNGAKLAARGGLRNTVVDTIIFGTDDDCLDFEKCANCQVRNNGLYYGRSGIRYGRPGAGGGFVTVRNTVQYCTESFGGDPAAPMIEFDHNVSDLGNTKGFENYGPNNIERSIPPRFDSSWLPTDPGGGDAASRIAVIAQQVHDAFPGSATDTGGGEGGGGDEGQGEAPDYEEPEVPDGGEEGEQPPEVGDGSATCTAACIIEVERLEARVEDLENYILGLRRNLIGAAECLDALAQE